MTSPIDKLPPQKLAHLLDPESLPEFSCSESVPVFRHQLDATLLPDLAIPDSEPARLEALIRDRPATNSFLQQLATTHPSLELLQAIKNFARYAQSTPTHPLHGDAANLLYYAAIAAALLRLNTRITRLSTLQLQEAFQWSLTHPAAQPIHHILKSTFEAVLVSTK